MNMAKRLLRYSLPYWRALTLAFVLILSTSLAINYLPVLIQRMTDSCLMAAQTPAPLPHGPTLPPNSSLPAPRSRLPRS